MFHPHDHAQWQTLAAVGSVPVMIVATAIAAAVPGLRRTVATMAGAIARRRPACGVAVFALSLAVSGAVAWRAGIPRPVIHDEFGYLLAADTFARGRLTNPTPPGADALQSPHELVRPTYMSKYPPGQGLALAAGQVAVGLPIVGVWVTAALAAAAVYWAALAFVPVPWAALAGAVAALHPQLVDWTHVYWGGSVAELGGALVVGAAGRFAACGPADQRPPIREAASGRAALALGIGLAILAVSRPYEGLAFVAPLPFLLARHARRLALPVLIVLVPAAAFTLYDDHAITGHALTPPIVAYVRQFDVYPKLWFLPRRALPPAYPNALVAQVHLEFEHGDYDALRTPAGLARIALHRARQWASEYAQPWALLLPLAVAGLDRRARWLWAMLGTLLLGLWAETFFLPHYAAPATAAVVVLVAIGWRRLPTPLAVGVGAAFVVAAAVSAATVGVGPVRAGRDDVIPALGPGRQLVFVRYGPGHLSSDEWVYNDADPPAERVVWAHSAGPAGDRQLARLYPGRRPWLLSVGAADLRLDRYPLEP